MGSKLKKACIYVSPLMTLIGVFLSVTIIASVLSNRENEVDRKRILPEYNCSSSIMLGSDEKSRIISNLTTIKKDNFDVVVLNFTVSLDCLVDVKFSYTRIFMANSRGLNVIRHYAASDALPLWLFGINSTVLNVPVSSEADNTKTHYTLTNLTLFVEEILLGVNLSAGCYFELEDLELNTADYFLWIFFLTEPNLYRETYLCISADGSKQPVIIRYSGLGFVVYLLGILITSHLSILDYFFNIDSHFNSKSSKSFYSRGDTPYSFRRMTLHLQAWVKKFPKEKWTKRLLVVLCILTIVTLCSMNVLLFRIYLKSTFERFWRELYFINDDATYSYIKHAYDYPYRGDYGEHIWLVKIPYYSMAIVIACVAVPFLSIYKGSMFFFTLFRPRSFFIASAEKVDLKPSTVRQFDSDSTIYMSQSYKCLFKSDFYLELLKVSLEHGIKFADYKCACISKLLLFPLYILCVFVNILVNVVFFLAQTLFPVLRHLFSGWLEKSYASSSKIYWRLLVVYPTYFFIYLEAWVVLNIVLFKIIVKIVSFVVYLVAVCVPYNPKVGVPLAVIVLSLIQATIVLVDDFQSEYKVLLDSLFENLEEIYKNRTENPVGPAMAPTIRSINVKLFNTVSSQYISTCRNILFSLLKAALIIVCISIAVMAFVESSTSIEVFEIGDFISITVLALFPQIIRSLLAPCKESFNQNLKNGALNSLTDLHERNELWHLVETTGQQAQSDNERHRDGSHKNIRNTQVRPFMMDDVLANDGENGPTKASKQA